MRTLTRFAAVALVLATAGAVCAQTATIPLPPLVLQGHTSQFKLVMDMDMTMFMMNQSMPMRMTMVLLQKQQYGKHGADGLVPVTTSMTLSRFDGSAMGQAMPSMKGKMPKIPSVTSFFDRQGQLRDIKISGMQMKGVPKNIRIDATQFAQSANAFAPPSGEVQIGVPITRQIELPMDGMNLAFSVDYTPIDIVTAGGEEAVKFFVSSDTQIDLSMDAAKWGLPKDFAGKGNAQITGEMLVGTKTGELIKQDMDMGMMFTCTVAQSEFAADLKMKLTGYRLK